MSLNIWSLISTQLHPEGEIKHIMHQKQRENSIVFGHAWATTQKSGAESNSAPMSTDYCKVTSCSQKIPKANFGMRGTTGAETCY